jgi:hypothetical protein
MADVPRAAAIQGTTMRWTWTDGPTKGKAYDHVFHHDGTVEWHDAGAAPRTRPGKEPERVPYAAFEVTPDIFAVSYLSTAGYTLTVVLNFATKEMVGVASGAKEWHPVRGTFEIVG